MEDASTQPTITAMKANMAWRNGRMDARSGWPGVWGAAAIILPKGKKLKRSISSSPNPENTMNIHATTVTKVERCSMTLPLISLMRR